MTYKNKTKNQTTSSLSRLINFSGVILFLLAFTLFSVFPVMAASLLSQDKAPHLAGKYNKTDVGIINKEKVLYWLKKQKKIDNNASKERQSAMLQQFVSKAHTRNKSAKQKRKPQSQRLHRSSSKHKHKQLSPLITSVATNEELVNIDNKELNLQKVSSALITNASNTTVKVLAVLIDFPDLPFDDNGLNDLDTDMYYSNYLTSHYTNLLFSPTGFSGPYGENLLSVYQYYQQESGQSLHFTGEVFDWVTADKHANYYGENSFGNENDVNVDELVIEAITKAVAKHNINLSEFDQSDLFDIDDDGITNEPDGIVDHIIVFHSSIGEEAGGGELGDDAIWSHRYFVFNDNDQPITIAGSSTRIYGYTINAIDASTGVVAHEFGHDLGLRDEYDLTSPSISAAVSNWSIMDSGAWLYQGTAPSGSSPSSFSPQAKEYLQNTYNGNWINQYELGFSNDLLETLDLVAANDHDGAINQVKVNLPPNETYFGDPSTGSYQFYSGKGADLNNSIYFSADISSNSTLTMQAHWQIEDDYDYMQVNINGVAIEGNHTQRTNPQYANVNNYISGSSQSINGVDHLEKTTLSYDLSEYVNQTVLIGITYTTDSVDNELGMAIDDISITDGNNNTTFEHSAETNNNITLNGFTRIKNTITIQDHNYYIQLRDLSGSNKSLASESLGYEPGVLVWYHNQAFENNNISEHPGEGFIGVVDADQNPLTNRRNVLDVSLQLRDASFSLFNQNDFTSDTHLNNSAIFSDINDYSAPYQSETGLTLPTLGFSSEVIAQSGNSDTATIKLQVNNAPHIAIEQQGLTVNLTLIDILNSNISNVRWLLGNNSNELNSSNIEYSDNQSITHTYNTAGENLITVTYNSGESEENNEVFHTLTLPITVGDAVTANLQLTTNDLTLNYSAEVSGGYGDLSYHWDFNNQFSSTAVQGSHTYLTPNIYDVVLTITDETSTAYVFIETIDISLPLNAVIEEDITALTVNFSSTISDGVSPYTYSWRFGDDATSTELAPTHRYENSGTYTVTLIITDAINNAITVTKDITVKAAKKSSGGSTPFISLLCLIALFLHRSPVKND